MKAAAIFRMKRIASRTSIAKALRMWAEIGRPTVVVAVDVRIVVDAAVAADATAAVVDGDVVDAAAAMVVEAAVDADAVVLVAGVVAADATRVLGTRFPQIEITRAA